MTSPLLREVRASLKAASDPERARASLSFFKTKKGQYGAGDQFFGTSVPVIRRLAKRFRDLSFVEIDQLFASPWHEERLLVLIILVDRFRRAETPQKQKEVMDCYLSHLHRVNNWDLVDVSAPPLLGEWLLHRPKTLLTRLAHSSSLWERRIAMVSTLAFIRAGQSEEVFRLTKILLTDSHDLIHKAIGWMLREVGKCCGKGTLDTFLDLYASRLPRTALRYAIERHSPAERLAYLAKKRV